MADPDVIYYRWCYSPTTGDVTLAHNHEGHPTDVRFHADMADERPESDCILGFAHRNESGWTILDQDSRQVDDPHVIESVERAVERDRSLRKQATDVGEEYGSQDQEAPTWDTAT